MLCQDRVLGPDHHAAVITWYDLRRQMRYDAHAVQQRNITRNSKEAGKGRVFGINLERSDHSLVDRRPRIDRADVVVTT